MRPPAPSPTIRTITKMDRDQDRPISTETICSFASCNSYSYFETSALTGHNVYASFWGTANSFVFTSTQTAPPSPAITAITKVAHDQDRVISTETAPPSPVVKSITTVNHDQDRVISTEAACSFTSRNSYSYFETSALTGHNLYASFWGIASSFACVHKHTDCPLLHQS